jgi:hypothetical protein
LTNDEIANMFEAWSKSGPLRGNFLVGIGYRGLRFKEGDGIEDERGIIEGIEDKVTQDVDKSEGTGTWSTKVSIASVPVRQLLKYAQIGDRRTTCSRPSDSCLAPTADHLGKQAGTYPGVREPQDPSTDSGESEREGEEGDRRFDGDGGLWCYSRGIHTGHAGEYE